MTATLPPRTSPYSHDPAEDLEGQAFNADMRVLEIRDAVRRGVSMQRILEYGRHLGRWDAVFVRKVLTDARMSTVQLDAIAPLPRPAPRVVRLHPLQIRVLDALCDGVATTDLVGHLGDVSEHTVKHHLRMLPKRLGAANAVQAVAWALSGTVRALPADD